MNINNKKVIIITGSNRGIGLGIVKALSEMNDFIIILTSRDKEKGEKVWLEMTEEIPKLKNYLFYHQLDITCLESIQIFLTFIKEKFIKIDILVNNAGVYIRSFTTEAFDLTFNTNFYSTVNFTEEIIQKNLLNQGGKIIFISSSFGKLKKLKKDNLKNQFMNNELTVENLIQLIKKVGLEISIQYQSFVLVFIAKFYLKSLKLRKKQYMFFLFVLDGSKQIWGEKMLLVL